MEPTDGFISRLLPAPLNGGYQQADYWVWCGSVIQATNPGEDGRYHMYASRWDKRTSFSPYWLFRSEIVRASSDQPEGPYGFEEVALPRRSPHFFDGMVTHNPSIKKFGEQYLLYYMGTTYDEDAYDSLIQAHGCFDIQIPAHEKFRNETWNKKRIGLAVSDTVRGPWRRLDQPLLEPRPGKWDSFATTNPSVCIRDDGYSVMIYKSRTVDRGLLQLGIATAKHPTGPFTPISDDATFPFHAEDPYIWFEDDQFQIIMKDMTGKICGEHHAGIHATSPDGIRWQLSQPPKAYSRTIHWEDGTTTIQGSFERPNLLFHNGKPTHLFAATADGPGGFWQASKTWSMCIPLKPKY